MLWKPCMGDHNVEIAIYGYAALSMDFPKVKENSNTSKNVNCCFLSKAMDGKRALEKNSDPFLYQTQMQKLLVIREIKQ